MSEQERWPRPLRASFRIAMREKPPEVIRNPEFREEIRQIAREYTRKITARFESMQEAVEWLQSGKRPTDAKP